MPYRHAFLGYYSPFTMEHRQIDEVFSDPSFNTFNEPQALPAACKNVPRKASSSRRKNLQTPVSIAEALEERCLLSSASPLPEQILQSLEDIIAHNNQTVDPQVIRRIADAVTEEIREKLGAVDKAMPIAERVSDNENGLQMLMKDSDEFELEGSFTIEMVVRHDGNRSGGWQILAGRWDDRGGKDPFQMYFIPDTHGLYVASDTDSVRRDMFVKEPLPANRPVTVTMEIDVDAGEMRVAYDGEVVGRKIINAPALSHLDPKMNPQVGIGKNPWGGMTKTIHVNEFRLYKGAGMDVIGGKKERVDAAIVTKAVEKALSDIMSAKSGEKAEAIGESAEVVPIPVASWKYEDGPEQRSIFADRPEFVPTGDLTIEATVLSEGGYGGGIVTYADSRGGKDPYILAVIGDGRLYFGIEGNSGKSFLLSENPIPQGQSIRIVARLDANTGKMSLQAEGQSTVETVTDVRPGRLDARFSPALSFGSLNDGTSKFKGVVESGKVFYEVVSEDELLKTKKNDSGSGNGGQEISQEKLEEIETAPFAPVSIDVKPGRYGKRFEAASSAGEITISGSGGVKAENVGGVPHFSGLGEGWPTVEFPEGTLINRMHVVPNAIQSTGIHVIGIKENGEFAYVYKGWIMEEGDIQWNIPDDIVGISSISFWDASQGGMMGNFVQLNDREAQGEAASANAAWENIDAPTGVFSSQERKDRFLNELDRVEKYFVRQLLDPVRVRTDGRAVEFIFSRRFPELSPENFEKTLESRVRRDGSPGQIAESRSYARKMMMEQAGDARREIHRGLVNAAHNIEVEAQYAIYLLNNPDLYVNARREYDGMMGSARRRGQMGIRDTYGVGGFLSRESAFNVVINGRKEFEALKTHFDAVRQSTDRLPVGTGAQAEGADALEKWIEKLPDDLRKFFLGLNNEQRMELYAAMNNREFLASLPEGMSSVLVAAEGGVVADAGNAERGESFGAVGVGLSVAGNDMKVSWGDISGVDRVNLSLMETNGGGEWIDGKVVQKRLPDQGAYMDGNVGSLNDGRYQWVLTGEGAKIVGVSSVFSVGNPVMEQSDTNDNNASNNDASDSIASAPHPYDIGRIDGKIVGERDVTILPKGTAKMNFAITEASMVNLWVDGNKAGIPDLPAYDIDVSLSLSGTGLEDGVYNSSKPNSGESISAVLPAGKYELTISDNTYYDEGISGVMRADGIVVNANIGINIKPYATQKIEGRVSIEGSKKTMPVSMGVAEFIQKETGEWERKRQRDTSPLNPNKPVWVVVHGRGDSEHGNNIELLAQKLSLKEHQVVTIGWEEAARDNGLILGSLDGARWIPAIGKWTAGQLKAAGFSGEHVIVAGHSWGSFVAYEIGNNYKNGSNGNGHGIQAIVAMDSPIDPLPNDYPVNNISFNNVSNVSLALRSSIFGSAARSNTADYNFDILSPKEKFERQIFTTKQKLLIDAVQAYYREHGYAISYFANLVGGFGDSSLNVIDIQKLVNGEMLDIAVDHRTPEGVLPITIQKSIGAQGEYWQAVPTSLRKYTDSQ